MTAQPSGLDARPGRCTTGFSLVEMAVVLLILGILIAVVVRPLAGQQEKQAVDRTQRVLEEAREALLAYAVSHGFFPCPADSGSVGFEAAGADHSTGACATWYGYVPAALLGLSDLDSNGYAVDGQGAPANRIRYAVSNQAITGVTNPFTRASGFRRVGPSMMDSEAQFFICGNGVDVTIGTDCGTATALTSSAVVVIWSVGANALTGGASPDEAENPNPNGGSAERIFVSRPRSVVAGGEFDDSLLWISAGALLERLLVVNHFR